MQLPKAPSESFKRRNASLYGSEPKNAPNQAPERNKGIAARSKRPKSYSESVVNAFFAEQGIPKPDYEYRFHDERRWRFDLAWPKRLVAVEVDGGIWVNGGHNRGKQMLKTWEKENHAAVEGWRILRCQPKDLCTTDFATLIKLAISLAK